ncbi:MAG: 2-amino-4-hydroxy-6-hydroxymethyldihydropteridine diphosphokinase [Actinomycetota bacterium]|nr:2-amino-4-hydroxy-6-hydroxymethyldihydropteridine diphosphokinase [Actinomycetota bacterium]
MRTSAYIGLGSNLGDREANLRRAVEAVDASSTWLKRVSSFRDTEPVGFENQPRFLNAAMEVGTVLSARELLESLLEIEQRLGRVRDGQRFGPRTIDLDLLVYGDSSIVEPGLSVPHPRLHERRFVLEPLAEIAPQLVIPGLGRVTSLLAKLE